MFNIINNIYIFCLAVGVIYTAVTTLINGVVSSFDFDIDLDFDLDANFNFFLPMKPFTIMIFITTFGASGLILLNFLKDIFTLPFAFIIAYSIAKFLYQTVYLYLVKSQTFTKGKIDAVGVIATVREAIPHNGTGRITYVVNKNILSAAAKEYFEEENGIKKDTKVLIVNIKQNIFYVTTKLDYYTKN